MYTGVTAYYVFYTALYVCTAFEWLYMEMAAN